VSRPSPAVQDYLKTIYMLLESEEESDSVATTSQVAEALGVTAASASNMLKRMDQLGYVDLAKRQGVGLTDEGRSAALEVVRTHRLLETYLVDRLGVPWDEVHREAEVLEHHISPALGARIDAALGHPDRDPHGHPIPRPQGDVQAVEDELLSRLPDGASGVVRQVSDHDGELLRFLGELGLVPDADIVVIGRKPFGGPILVAVAGREVEVPPEAATAVRVG
jgi:DtxR family Mn-dependent transcriptional regulator